MEKVLVVAGTESFANLVQQRLSTLDDITVITAPSMAEAERHTQSNGNFSLALLDRDLPDAPNGEVLNAMVKQGIPSILFTASASGVERADFYERGAFDYIMKDGPGSLDYLLALVRRALRNRHIKAVVVDDSGVTRGKARRILKRFGLTVFEAVNGQEALQCLSQHPDTKLILTEFDMPVMNGLDLIQTVRKTRNQDDLAIIGMSSAGMGDLSAKFIKMGANDFIGKPFSDEEFLCRVSQSLDRMEQMEALKAAAAKDFLTGLYNQRFFYEAATPTFAQARRQERNLAVLVLDIDRFKQVRESHGRDAANTILIEVAKTVKERVRDADILARMSGGEFCLLLFDAEPDSLAGIASELLERVAKCDIRIDGKPQNVTASIGMCAERLETLEEMIQRADDLLARAKESGRNRAIMASGHSRGETIKGPARDA